ncbi:hypothetical protein ACE1CA_35490 [Aerosakkonemataceae cyanobacterium BLCC-F167]|uniref:Uncharacterized protein n=1 Tax=Floridaenema evergladense BLCC-F167 TaxID=3153639 RepID=A0ABV4WYE5_9CYAN
MTTTVALSYRNCGIITNPFTQRAHLVGSDILTAIVFKMLNNARKK